MGISYKNRLRHRTVVAYFHYVTNSYFTPISLFLRIIYTAPTTNVRAAMNAYAIKRHSVYRKMFLISEQSIPTT